MSHTFKTDPHSGTYARLKCDQNAMRQQNRDRRHEDAQTVRRILRDPLTEAGATFTRHRRDVYALPSW